MNSIRLKISGMNCAGCAAGIERNVKKVPGVLSAVVNFPTQTGKFEFKQDAVSAEIKKKLIELGYEYIEQYDIHQLEALEKTKNKELFSKFLVGITFSIFLFLLAMGPLTGWPNPGANWWIQFALATPVWLWVGSKFQKAAFVFFKTGRSNMDTLIGIGTSAAYLYSTFITFFPETSRELGLSMLVYFEAVGFITSFVFLGQYLESLAKGKTTAALKTLLSLESKEAWLKSGTDIRKVAIDSIAKGQTIVIKPGEKITLDGKVTHGQSYVDEALLTGESQAVNKSEGDDVYAGTINGKGVLEVKVAKTSAETVLSQIIRFVENAQLSKPPIQRHADKISAVFTPVILVISVLTLIIWWFWGAPGEWGIAISNFIAVLVIACPCALGLATPTAVSVALGVAAKRGVLLKGGDIIEKTNHLDAIVFDKTGTLTVGKPQVTDSVLAEVSEDQKQGWLKAIAAIESRSEHPLSLAICSFVGQANLPAVEEFKLHEGKGVEGTVNGAIYVIGRQVLLEESGINLNNNLLDETKMGTPVYIARDKSHVGTLYINDQIKPNAKTVVSRLKALGFTPHLLTGDTQSQAKTVAGQVGIDHVFSEVLPLDKSAKVKQLQAEGRKVIMVGDGINDAPALSQADLSVAMGSGSDLAIHVSDVTIMNGDVDKLVGLLDLSKFTMKVIKQNLFFSLFYNSILIPVAAGALLVFGGPKMPPVLASVAMGLSSISVVLNSLRIRTPLR